MPEQKPKSILYDPAKKKSYNLTELFENGREALFIGKHESESCVSIGLAELEYLDMINKDDSKKHLLKKIVERDAVLVYNSKKDAFFIGGSLKKVRACSTVDGRKKEYDAETCGGGNFYKLKSLDKLFIGGYPLVFARIFSREEKKLSLVPNPDSP